VTIGATRKNVAKLERGKSDPQQVPKKRAEQINRTARLESSYKSHLGTDNMAAVTNKDREWEISKKRQLQRV